MLTASKNNCDIYKLHLVLTMLKTIIAKSWKKLYCKTCCHSAAMNSEFTTAWWEGAGYLGLVCFSHAIPFYKKNLARIVY